MAHEVFISYSSPDRAAADAICSALEDKQIPCWMAPRNVIPGEDYAAGIIKAISECRLMVVVFSAHCNVSEDVQNEVAAAASQKIVIIPVRIEDVQPKGALQYHLLRRHWLDALTPPLECHLKRLSQVVGSIIAAKYGPTLEREINPSPEPVSPDGPGPFLENVAPAASGLEPVSPLPDKSVAPVTPALESQPVIGKPEPIHGTEEKRGWAAGRRPWACALAVAGLAFLIFLAVITISSRPDLNQMLVEAGGAGDLQQVQRMLDRGAEVNAKDNHDSTTLMLASQEGHLDVVKLLLEKGAGVNTKNNLGSTALMGAASRGYSEIVKLLLERAADVNTSQNDGSTALTLAAYNCQSEVVKLLLAKGADVHSRTSDGATAVMLATAPQGGTAGLMYRDCLEIVSVLLSQGADVNATGNSDGRTPLAAAAAQGNLEIVKLLLEKGANTDIRDKEGKTALMLASEKGHVQVANLLKATAAKVQSDLEELKDLSKKYHESYVASNKDDMMDFYDFPIKYFGRGDRYRTSVDSAWDSYFAQWTARESQIKAIEIQIDALAVGEATSRLVYSYRWTDDSGKDVTGNATCFITWKKINNKWKVKGLDEKKGEAPSNTTNSSWRRVF